MSQSPDPTLPLTERIANRLPSARAAVDRLRAWGLTPLRSAERATRTTTLRGYNRLYGSDDLLSDYLDPSRLEFYEEVAERCAPLRPRRVIDVGCGTGHVLRFLVDRLSAKPQLVLGVDHADAGIRRAEALVPEGHWIVGDLYDLTAEDERFDLVLCTEVLEHLREPARAAGILLGLCAPGGRVAITVPDGAKDSWRGHVNFWTEDELRTFLAPYGLVKLERIQNGDVLLAWLSI